MTMRITCWGSRGSIPVSGKQYLKYGGDTTCIEIRTKNDETIIIDAGTGIRRLGNRLIEENRFVYHVIFTHAHWDHVMGFPYFKPLYFEHARFMMHRCPFHSKFVETILAKVMAPPNFPVRYSDLKADISYEDACPLEFQIGPVEVVPIPLSHPNGGSGYKFIEDGKTFVFLTDNELGFTHSKGGTYSDYVEFSRGADFLIHDAEYTPEEYATFVEWGHSETDAVIQLAMDAGVKRLGLFHVNQERTDDQMDEIVTQCRKKIAANGFDIDCFGVGADMHFDL
jgi:phosphoribosyl 1,2-cyclic phosphodiesterase